MSSHLVQGKSAAGFPQDLETPTMERLVTPKQLAAIRGAANAKGINAETECLELLKCKPEQLSRRAASAFIDYLNQQPRRY